MFNKQRRRLKYLCLRLLRINDKAYSIAIGFTIGFLMHFVPSFGLGPFFSTVLPRIFKGNTVAGFIGGLAFIWIFPFLFYMNIIVGEALLPIRIETKIEIIIEELEEGFVEPEEAITASIKIGKAFLIGMVFNMIVVGTFCYIVVYYIIKKYRQDLLMVIYKKWTIPKQT